MVRIPTGSPTSRLTALDGSAVRTIRNGHKGSSSNALGNRSTEGREDSRFMRLREVVRRRRRSQLMARTLQVVV
jgi:hypothetical protein